MISEGASAPPPPLGRVLAPSVPIGGHQGNNNESPERDARGGRKDVEMASNVTATMDCNGVITFTASHAEWGQSMQIQMMGETYTMDRPDGWWDGDGPNDRWSVTGSYQTPGDVTLTWTDHEGGSLVHGPIRLTVDESCATTTTGAPPSTVAEVVELPTLVVDAPTTTASMVSAPDPSLPVGVEVTVDPYSTLPAGVTTSVNEKGDVVYSDCVIVVECDDVRFDVVTTVAAAPFLPETGTEYAVPFGFTAFVLCALGWWCVRRPAHRVVW